MAGGTVALVTLIPCPLRGLRGGFRFYSGTHCCLGLAQMHRVSCATNAEDFFAGLRTRAVCTVILAILTMVHVRFDDDDDDMDTAERPIPQQGHSNPPASTSSMRTPNCFCSQRVDNNKHNPAYVFKAFHNAANNAVIASTSSNIVKTYQLTSSLSHVGDLKGHSNTITEVGFFTSDTPNLVHTSSSDGSLRGWDLRSGQQVEGFTSTHELLCCSVSGNMAAAGGQGEVLFWDRRTGGTMAALQDTHMEDVTQVKLQTTGHLISASVDGLIAVHDVSKSFDDDENFQAALNLGTSVEEVGVYGAQGGKLWVRTGTESLHLWEWLRATQDEPEGAVGGSMAFADFIDARGTAAQSAAAADCPALSEQVEYLIGCHYDAASNQVMLMAGTDGTVGFWPLSEQLDASGTCTGAAITSPVMLLQGGHTAVVRTVQVFGEGTQGPFCISGGEDSQICLWDMQQGAAAAATGQPVAATAAAVGAGSVGMDVDAGNVGPERPHRKQGGLGKSRRPSPY